MKYINVFTLIYLFYDTHLPFLNVSDKENKSIFNINVNNDM